MTYHFSGAAWVEEARQNLLRARATLDVLRAQFDLKAADPDPELASAFVDAQVAVIAAEEDFEMRRAMTLPPYDLTLIPVVVEQRLTGDPDPVTMVLVRNPDVIINPGERYVISGARSTSMLPPPIAHMGTADNITEYVEVFRAELPDAVARDLEWLASIDSKTAIVTGSLTMQNFGDGVSSSWATEFRGTRILVSSGSRELETVIAENGRFELRGVAPGRLQIRAALPKDLTLTNVSKTTIDVVGGSCTEVRLTANINGRVRGRIRTTASPVGQVKVRLLEMNPDRLRDLRPGTSLMVSHSVRIETALNADGTFELYGVPPGWYVLSAWVEAPKDSPRRSVHYYPGTPEMAYATPIEVGRATVHDGFDFTLLADDVPAR